MNAMSAIRVLLLLFGSAALAADDDAEAFRTKRVVAGLGADRFIAGETATLREAVSGDAFLAGGDVLVDQSVGGDLVAAGGEIRIDAVASQDVYAAGGRVLLDGSVGRNARVAGGRVDIGPRARVAGNVTMAGGRIAMRGAVDGYVQVAGERILLDGPVGGDVEARGQTIELGPDARIAGTLRYASGKELIRDPAAQVQGEIEQLPQSRAWTNLGRAGRSAAEIAFWVWSLGLILLAAVLVLVAPVSMRVADTVRGRLMLSFVIGFVALVSVPVAAALLLATGVGAPLGVLALLGYAAALLVGYVFAGVALGQVALGRMRGASPTPGWRAGAAALGLLALAIVSRIPFAGAVIALLALIIGTGALVLQFAPAVSRAAA